MQDVRVFEEAVAQAKRIVTERPSYDDMLKESRAELERLGELICPEMKIPFNGCIDELSRQLKPSVSTPICFCGSGSRLLFACELCTGNVQFFCETCSHLQKMPCSSKYKNKYLCQECCLRSNISTYCTYSNCSCGLSFVSPELQQEKLQPQNQVTLHNGRKVDVFTAYYNSYDPLMEPSTAIRVALSKTLAKYGPKPLNEPK